MDESEGSPSNKMSKKLLADGEMFGVLQAQVCIRSELGGPCFMAGDFLDKLPVHETKKDFTILADKHVDPHTGEKREWIDTMSEVPLKPGEMLVWQSKLVGLNVLSCLVVLFCLIGLDTTAALQQACVEDRCQPRRPCQ